MLLPARIATGKEHEGAFWGVRNVLHLDLNNGYMSVSLCKNSLSYTLKIWTFYVCLKTNSYTSNS